MQYFDYQLSLKSASNALPQSQNKFPHDAHCRTSLLVLKLPTCGIEDTGSCHKVSCWDCRACLFTLCPCIHCWRRSKLPSRCPMPAGAQSSRRTSDLVQSSTPLRSGGSRTVPLPPRRECTNTERRSYYAAFSESSWTNLTPVGGRDPRLDRVFVVVVGEREDRLVHRSSSFSRPFSLERSPMAMRTSPGWTRKSPGGLNSISPVCRLTARMITP